MKRFLSVLAGSMLAVIIGMPSSAADRGSARAGITAGLTLSSSNAKFYNANAVAQYHVGLAAQLPIAFGFALQPAVVYQTKGTKLKDSRIEDIELNAKVGYIEIPVQIQWGPDLMAFRPYAFAEPFIGYGLNSRSKESGTASLKTSSFGKAGLSRWEYGLGLGAGIDFWKMQFSVKYYWNFGSLYNESGEMNAIGRQVKEAFKDGRNFNGITFSLSFFF